MSERNRILGRIREALKNPAPKPGSHGHPPHASAAASQVWSQFLPPVGDKYEDWVTAFRAASNELKSEFHVCAGPAEAHAYLVELRRKDSWKSIASHAGSLTSPACAALEMTPLWTSGRFDMRELEQCDVGISECDALVAQTGSVLVTSRSAGGRALSVLPPHHIVLARREQLLPDLPSAFRLIHRSYAPDYPSMISFITGPSRTGDIERILVLGAHGPRRLTILLF